VRWRGHPQGAQQIAVVAPAGAKPRHRDAACTGARSPPRGEASVVTARSRRGSGASRRGKAARCGFKVQPFGRG
jgi:hypothetical protein